MFGLDDIVKGFSSGTVEGIVNGADKLIRTFKMPPDELAKWEAQKEQLKADIESKRAENERLDKDSARKREMEVKDRTPAILAYVIVGGFLAATLSIIASALLGYEIPAAGAGLLGTLIGYLAAKSELALTYYFGSTFGSSRKTELLAQAEAIK